MNPSILPAELWDAIFSECENTPLCLSQICSYLRTTAHANSKLWSVINIIVYKRGLWGGIYDSDNSIYIARTQADSIAQCLRLSGTHPITLSFVASGLRSTEYRPEAFELAEQSPVFPLVRSALGRCREFKVGAFVGNRFNNAISGLLRGMALPMLQDVSFYGSGWDSSHALQLILAGAPNIRRIYFSAYVLAIPRAYLDWARTIHEFRLGQCQSRSRGHSIADHRIADQFPNISNLSIDVGTTFGLRNVLKGLCRLTSLSLYMNYISQKYMAQLVNVDIPTLEELSLTSVETPVQYPVDEWGFVHLIHRAPLRTLRLVRICIRSVSLLSLLQRVQPTLRVLIISEPHGTITPYCPLSPAFLAQMQDRSFLPILTSLHLVWNHDVDEKAVIDMLEHRAFDAVSVGRGMPFEGMDEDVKRRVLRLNVAYPPLLREPYGSEI